MQKCERCSKDYEYRKDDIEGNNLEFNPPLELPISKNKFERFWWCPNCQKEIVGLIVQFIKSKPQASELPSDAEKCTDEYHKNESKLYIKCKRCGKEL